MTGEGWKLLTDGIQEFLKLYPPKVEFTTMKEKYGTLSFYYSGGDRFIDGMISFAEQLSGTICEKCGKSGEIRGSSWMVTECDKCYSAKK